MSLLINEFFKFIYTKLMYYFASLEITLTKTDTVMTISEINAVAFLIICCYNKSTQLPVGGGGGGTPIYKVCGHICCYQEHGF